MAHQLTAEEKAVHFETWEHIHQVQKLMIKVQAMLGQRALEHDHSKIYSEEECAAFAEFTPKLKDIPFGGEEYKACLASMGPAITHHQTSNRHHPEFFGTQGLAGMTLIDLLEMLCDWKAATLRSPNGDIRRSIELAKERFGLSPQLASILLNTAALLQVA